MAPTLVLLSVHKTRIQYKTFSFNDITKTVENVGKILLFLLTIHYTAISTGHTIISTDHTAISTDHTVISTDHTVISTDHIVISCLILRKLDTMLN